MLTLQSRAGNHAVSSLLTDRATAPTAQRDKVAAGWEDADRRGAVGGWNVTTHDVGTIRRVPLEGLSGNKKDAVGDESNKTTESAAGRAIVLIPGTVKPGQQVDVLFHFHGFTHREGDPYAGWRQHKRSGTVRDVDQDRIEGQLEVSGQKSMIAVMPQGVGGSNFGGLDVDSYLTEVFTRLAKANEPPGSAADKPLTRGRLVMSGHSGGGDRIANMLDSATGQKAAEVILFEAIHKGGLQTVLDWAKGHLERVQALLKKAKDPAERAKIVESCPKLFAYCSVHTKGDPMSGMYVSTYDKLEKALNLWFDQNGAALGTEFADVRARFRVEKLTGASHETIIRGLGDDPKAGPLTDALVSLDKPRTTADPATSKLVRTGASTWVPPNSQPKVGPTSGAAPKPDSPANPPTLVTTPKDHPATPPAPSPTTKTAPPAGAAPVPTGPSPIKGAAAGPTSGGSPPSTKSTALTPISLTPERILAIAFARGLNPLRILATLPTMIRGGDSYAVLADTLAAAGMGDNIDLTDALFDAAHPELGGSRIPADKEDLKAEWRLLRTRYARPAIAQASSGPASSTAAGPTVAAPTTAPTAAPPTTAPAAAHAGPVAPAKVPAAPTTAGPDPSTPRVAAVDPATVRPSRAATGTKPLTEAEQQKAMTAALDQARTGGSKQARTDIDAVLDKYGLTVDKWFAGMNFSASFLDVPIQPSGGTTSGVHEQLLARLVMAEKTLAKQFPGLTKAQIAGKMGIYEIVGVRPPKAATGASQPSAHCFGLAIDINHPTNPFLGNNKPAWKKNMTDAEKAKYESFLPHRSPRIIERAMLLLHHEDFNVEAEIKVPKGGGSRAGKLWDIHHRASETLAEYLRLADDVGGKKLADLVTALRQKGDKRGLDDWKTLISEDRSLIKNWDFMYHKAPQTGGYLDLGKELVVALMDAGLLWGGEYGKEKDMMHFDWRGGTIQDRSSK